MEDDPEEKVPLAPPAREEDAPPPSRPRRPRRRGPTRAQIQRRRLVAAGVLAAILALAGIKLASGGEDEPAAVPVPEEAAKAVKGLSKQEKVDSVIAVGFDGTSAPDVAATQGGVVIGPGNWPGASQAPALTREIHASGGIPPLVIGVQEGGEYRAYPDLPPPDGEFDLGAAGDATATRDSYQRAAAAMKKAGFDLNLGPVADVATLDSPIADRAFGDESALVAAMTSAAIKGCELGRLLCAPSHFPGQGAANADTGAGPATVALDAATLLDRDVPPFVAAFHAGAPAVVLSHAYIGAYDTITPGSLTEAVATGLLRDELRFEGAAITDDLSAGAISAGLGAAEASVRALEAGADLLVISDPGEAAAARAAIAKAVESGDLSNARLDEAAGRVLALKREASLDISM